MDISIAIEGFSDEGVTESIVRSCGFSIGAFYGRNGKEEILKKIGGYNAAANYSPWLVVVDLDSDGPCPGDKRIEWLPEPSPNMCFRIAVHEMEAWLLADRQEVSRFLGVQQSLIPQSPEKLPDPKQVLVNLARRSKKRDIVRGLVPREGSGTSVGPTYASDIRSFASSQWRPRVAAESAPSLARCLHRLDDLARTLKGI